MKRNVIHIILIITFLLIPILSSPDLDATFSMFRVPMFQREMVQMALLIVLFYLNFLIFIPKFFDRKNYWLYALIVATSFLIVAILPQILVPNASPKLPPGPKMPTPNPQREFMLNMFRAILPFCFAFLSSFFWYKSLEQNRLERAKAKAELLNLKYQLQPHFLFNILNSIYSLALMKSDDAPEGILKLSNVMRYVVQESGEDVVELKKEIDYLKDYITLQLIRTDDSIDFSFKETGDFSGLKIAPMILVNFIENAFKYGFNAEEHSKISIVINTEGEILTLHVFNLIVNRNAKNDSLGVGLKNTIERLKQLYPGKAHSLEIKNDGTVFEVDLRINLGSKI